MNCYYKTSSTVSIMSGSKRAPSAYFIFGGEQRHEIREALLAEKRKELGDDAKVSVADVAKEIGRRWKELSEEERQRYKDVSAAKAKELAAAADCLDAVDEGVEKQQGKAMLPLSMVKKLACRDEEVKRVSGDAVRMIAEATGMFLGVLASKSLSHAVSQKRKNFKFSDIEHVSRKDRRMVDMGLHVSFEHEEPFRHLGGASGPAPGSSTRQKRSREEPDAPAVGIQKFFGV